MRLHASHFFSLRASSRSLFLGLVLLFLLETPLALDAQNSPGNDSIPTAISDKKHKSYFAWLSRYRQADHSQFIPKGSFMGGLSFNFNRYESKESLLFFNMLKDLDYNLHLYGIAPYVGYTFMRNQVIGGRFRAARIDGELKNINFSIGDNNFQFGRIHYLRQLYEIGLFYRSYIGLDEENRFGLFSELSANMAIGDASLHRGSEENKKVVDSRTYQYSLGFSPGLTVFVTQNIAMEVSFNVLGLYYRRVAQQIDNQKSGDLKASGLNLNINPFNVNISLTLCL